MYVYIYIYIYVCIYIKGYLSNAKAIDQPKQYNLIGKLNLRKRNTIYNLT